MRFLRPQLVFHVRPPRVPGQAVRADGPVSVTLSAAAATSCWSARNSCELSGGGESPFHRLNERRRSEPPTVLHETKAANITTTRGPIEVVYTDAKATISQCELGRGPKFFPWALRAALCQDPDILLIGEMRHKETVEAALSAA